MDRKSNAESTVEQKKNYKIKYWMYIACLTFVYLLIRILSRKILVKIGLLCRWQNVLHSMWTLDHFYSSGDRVCSSVEYQPTHTITPTEQFSTSTESNQQKRRRSNQTNEKNNNHRTLLHHQRMRECLFCHSQNNRERTKQDQYLFEKRTQPPKLTRRRRGW